MREPMDDCNAGFIQLILRFQGKAPHYILSHGRERVEQLFFPCPFLHSLSIKVADKKPCAQLVK
jgi:hypothetical protein